MANMKKIKVELKDASDAANSLAAILGVVTLLSPPIVSAVKRMEEKRKELVQIPPLHSRTLTIRLERATALLEELGFKVEPIAVKDSKIKYKDCLDMQIVDSKPKQKKKVRQGELVYLMYVTPDVILKSKKLFNEKLKKVTKKNRKRLTIFKKDE